MQTEIINLGYSATETKELIKVSKDINKDIEKLKNNYPIQYLIGYVNFYGYKINVNEKVLIPRYETEFLVEKTIKLIKKYFSKNIKILDIGTGSGAISIALSKELNTAIDAVDISKDAIKVAKKNVKENNAKVNIIESNIFSNIKDKYDVIISNPPYISKSEKIMDSVYKYEPHLALFADNNGLYFYEEILKEAKKYLNDKFIIAFEIGYTQGNEIINIAMKYYNDKKIILDNDLSGKNRYIFIISE